MNKFRKAFEVVIDDKEYDVFDIEGKEHEGFNDTPKTWWLYYANRLPEGLLPPVDSTDLVPYCVGTVRRLWDIRITQKNTSKYKWDSWNFRHSVSVEMYCNKKLVYAFGTGGSSLDFAMAKVRYMETMLQEHAFNFFEPEQENGRKIYWFGLPAFVKIKSRSWEIGIVPDYTCDLSKEDWWKEYKNRKSLIPVKKEEVEIFDDNEDFRSDYINWGDAFSDQHINWFRD